MAGYSDITLFRRLLRQTRAYWLHVLALFVLSLLATPVALLTPLPLRIAVDSVIGSHPLPRPFDTLLPQAAAGSDAVLLVFVVGLLIAIALLGQAQGLASALLRNYIKEKMVLDFRTQVFRHVQRISLSYHDTKGTADSVYRIQHDVPDIQHVLTESLIPFITSSVTLVGMIYVMARIDWQLAVVAIGISPALVVTARAFRRHLRGQSREIKKLDASALAIAQEVLGALRIVKAFGQEVREEHRFRRRGSEVMRARMRLTFMEGSFNVLVGLLTAAGMAAVVFIGISHVRSGVLTLGQLLLLMGYLNQLYEPLKTISKKAATLQLHLASAERAFALLDEAPDVAQRPDARALARAGGTIAFRRVSFAYGNDRPVLHDISFDIDPGTRLGIVGASGAGKSTLIHLLTRFSDPTGGQILLDGVDLRDYRLEDLRRQFAVVQQEPVLFATSIAENIAYAKLGATEDEIVAAAQAANAHEFIVRLPQGYDTQVGERGVQLSGGQRQRIAIARAFLKDCPVLILDEPTSAVDAEAEAAILDAVRRLIRGRTVILITHRPSMLEGCTALLVLENGRVASGAPGQRAVMPVPAPASNGRRSRLLQHPAVVAWSRLRPQSPPPAAITRLRGGPGRTPKSAVYRLDGAGPAGSPVVAKWTRKVNAGIERAVYEEILSSIAVPSLRYYGCIDDPDPEYCWLFLEEAGGEEYSYLLADHRAHAARWLGLLHPLAAALAATTRLPDAGPGRYLGCLRSAREAIQRHRDNPVLTADDFTFLEGLLARLGELESRWSHLEDACGGVPRTLVHGDFNGKNIRLRSTNTGPALEVFDWEDAGWGVPAVDLAQLAVPASRLSASPDVAVYWSAVRAAWPDQTLEDLHRLAHCGTVFRALATLSWDTHHLGHDWAHGFIGSMRLYDAELAYALEQLGWNRQTHAPIRSAAARGV